MGTIIELLVVPVEEETLYRLLYATGNCAIWSTAAKEKLLLRLDLIDQLQSSGPAPRIAALLNEIVGLLNH